MTPSRDFNVIVKIPLLLCLIVGSAIWCQAQDVSNAAQTGAAQIQPVTKGQRIFATHHSYFLQVPPILTEVAKAGGYPDQVIVGDDMIGGSKSIQHWSNDPNKPSVTQVGLAKGTVDVLILTPIYLPDLGIEKFAQLGFKHNPNIRVTVMEFWLPFDVYNPDIYDPTYQPIPGEPAFMPKPAKVDHNAATVDGLRKMHEYYFRTMDDEVNRVNKELGKQVVFVVPMGQAVLALREKVIAGTAPGIKSQEELFQDQLGHPNPPMQVLETYCHYAVIYRKSPVGLPVPTVLMTSKISPEDVAPLNLLLQELAWDAVTHHSLSGVHGT